MWRIGLNDRDRIKPGLVWNRINPVTWDQLPGCRRCWHWGWGRWRHASRGWRRCWWPGPSPPPPSRSPSARPKLQSWARDNTATTSRQHCRDNVNMPSGQNIVDYCKMSRFVVATPFTFGHQGLHIFIFFLSLLCCRCRIVLSYCRCREAKKCPRAQLCPIVPESYVFNGYRLGWRTKVSFRIFIKGFRCMNNKKHFITKQFLLEI